MDMPQLEQPDLVLNYLMDLQLAEHEGEFRGVLENILDGDAIGIRHMSVATVAVLMSLGGVPWTVVMRVLTRLKKRTDEELMEDAIAIVNGSHIIIPDSDDPRGVSIYDVRTLEEAESAPRGIVSTVYSITAIWDRAASLLPA